MKKFIAIFLTILITISSFTMVVAFASDIKSGKLNESVFWELSNGKLTVYGVGTVENPQSSSFIPWRKYADEIMQVEIKDGITGIGRAAFTKLKNVYNIPIPNSVTSIGQHAFSDCINLLDVKLPNNLKHLDTSAFYGCSNLKSVTIPKNITYMGGAVFEGCKNLTDVNIENGLKVIPSYTFSGCISLTSIDIPSSVSSIEEYAFYNCSSLQNVSIAGQPKIADNAYERCPLLESNKPNNESSTTMVNDRITVTLNGKLISFDVQPVNIDGRVLVPVRAIFEALGATVEWKQTTQIITGKKEDTTIIMQIDNNELSVNDNVSTLDVAPIVIDGRTLVPVRAIAESFGIDVLWYGDIKTVAIYDDKNLIEKKNLYNLKGDSVEIDVNFEDNYIDLGWSSDISKIERVCMYALDGRTKYVYIGDVADEVAVGWYTEPVVTMYALDGRTTIVYEKDIVANEKVGWYYGKPVTMYSADGRTQIVGENRVEEQKSVGWYTEPVVTMYAVENGNLKTITVLKSQVAANKKVGWRTDMPKSKVSTVTCDDCHGSGRRNCSYCDGLGFIRRFDGFLGDNNSGFNFFPSHSIPKYRNDPCILCSESGKETCDSCRGKGNVSTTVYYY